MAKEEIPEEIKMQIKDEAMRLYPHDDGMNKIDRDRFLDGAKFGYGLGRIALELAEDLLEKSNAACEQYSKENNELLTDKQSYIAGRTKSMDLEDACRELLNAPHYEHFAVRLNDEEMAALNKIKQLLNQTP